MQQKIVVMGGSFNPPTLAHLQLLLAGVEWVGGDRGLFVPAPFPFVQRKMERLGRPEHALPQSLRLELLELMAAEDPRLRVDDQETPYTRDRRSYETMVQLQEKYPAARLYFLAGGDIMENLDQWYRIEDFLTHFHLIGVRRGDCDPALLPQRFPFLARFPGKFHLLPPPDGVAGMSASLLRGQLWEGEQTPEGLVHPAVWRRLEEYRRQSGILREKG